MVPNFTVGRALVELFVCFIMGGEQKPTSYAGEEYSLGWWFRLSIPEGLRKEIPTHTLPRSAPLWAGTPVMLRWRQPLLGLLGVPHAECGAQRWERLSS